jgi:hypothetical protein
MNKTLQKTLFRTPRVLGILFILFVSLFALDIFDMNLGLWGTIVGLFMHLLPSITLTIALVLAWKYEWVGAILFALVGVWFLSISTPGDVMFYIVFIGVPLLIAALFLLGWIYRGKIRA